MKQVKNYELESRWIEIFISLFLKRGSKYLLGKYYFLYYINEYT